MRNVLIVMLPWVKTFTRGKRQGAMAASPALRSYLRLNMAHRRNCHRQCRPLKAATILVAATSGEGGEDAITAAHAPAEPSRGAGEGGEVSPTTPIPTPWCDVCTDEWGHTRAPRYWFLLEDAGWGPLLYIVIRRLFILEYCMKVVEGENVVSFFTSFGNPHPRQKK